MTATLNTALTRLIDRLSDTADKAAELAVSLREVIAADAPTATSDHLADLVSRLQRAHVFADTFRHAALMLSAGASDDEVWQWMFDLMLAGADDTWSGRGNDQRRRLHDARAESFRDLQAALRRFEREVED